MTTRGLLCNSWVQIITHRPARVGWIGWRCQDCGRVSATELGLLGREGDGYVSPGERTRFIRDGRYVTRPAA